jgi:hypothetical protein
MRAATLLTLALLAEGCAHPAREPSAAPSGARHSAAAASAVLGDTAAVRRLCVAPDSVLAGRKACELRNQAPFRTF